MADLNTALPPALRRALELLADPPTNPDVGKGYLDLLGTRPVEDAAVAKNTRAQALFASPVGSMLYDNTQAVMRSLGLGNIGNLDIGWGNTGDTDLGWANTGDTDLGIRLNGSGRIGLGQISLDFGNIGSGDFLSSILSR